MVRVAVIQIESTPDGSAALAACTREIERAVRDQAANIVVFPELALADEESLGECAVTGMLREHAARHNVWLLGSALQNGLTTILCVQPDGELRTRVSSDLEQTGRGTFAAEQAVLETPHGKIGVCAGPQGLHFQVARSLSAAGAELICVSLALRSDAELSLRVPARAVENQRFVAVAAHVSAQREPYPLHMATVPPAAPEPSFEPAPVSQIIAPHGHAVARGALAVAELALGEQTPHETLAEKKFARRTDLYRSLAARHQQTGEVGASVPEIDVALLAYQELGSFANALAWAREHLEELAEKDVSLVVLPELFCFDPGLSDLHVEAAREFVTVVQTLALPCRRTPMHVVTSLVERVEDQFFHVGVVIGQRGIVLRQPQLHIDAQHEWARPGRRLQTARLPWGQLALAVGADARVPELLDALGRAEVDVLAAPLSARAARSSSLTLSAAADEAGFAVLAATSPQRGQDDELASSSVLVDPSRWPAQRASAHQEVLRGSLRLDALRAARMPAR